MEKELLENYIITLKEEITKRISELDYELILKEREETGRDID